MPGHYGRGPYNFGQNASNLIQQMLARNESSRQFDEQSRLAQERLIAEEDFRRQSLRFELGRDRRADDQRSADNRRQALAVRKQGHVEREARLNRKERKEDSDRANELIDIAPFIQAAGYEQEETKVPRAQANITIQGILNQQFDKSKARRAREALGSKENEEFKKLNDAALVDLFRKTVDLRAAARKNIATRLDNFEDINTTEFVNIGKFDKDLGALSSELAKRGLTESATRKSVISQSKVKLQQDISESDWSEDEVKEWIFNNLNGRVSDSEARELFNSLTFK